MSFLADIILILFLVGFIFAGFKRGLTGSLIKLLSFVIAIILAIVLYKPLSNAIINNTYIDDNIKTSIINIFSSKSNNETTNNVNSETKNNEKTQTSNDSLQNTIINNINKDVRNATDDAKNTIIENSADRITVTIISIISGIIIFLLSRLILLIISICIKGITQLPIIKQIDKTGGLIYGALEGFVVVYIILGIISFANILWPGNVVNNAIVNSALCSILYNNNILLKFFFK